MYIADPLPPLLDFICKTVEIPLLSKARGANNQALEVDRQPRGDLGDGGPENWFVWLRIPIRGNE